MSSPTGSRLAFLSAARNQSLWTHRSSLGPIVSSLASLVASCARLVF